MRILLDKCHSGKMIKKNLVDFYKNFIFGKENTNQANMNAFVP